MKIDRTKNTIKNTIASTFSKVEHLLFPFIIRTIFIRTLGIEYLGLNSLFTSVLQMLNLMELGVGSALVFSMYRPIAEDDADKICALMRLYRKYYRIIGTVILVIGLLIIPFIPLLIHDEPPKDINLYIIYGMNLFHTVLSYWLFAYRNCLFQAHQKTDVVSYCGLTISLLTNITKLVVLLVFRNYYVFLSIGLFFQIVSNCTVALLSRKYYPNYVPKGDLQKSDVQSINKRVASLFTAKLGTKVHHSFDTIVVSAFLGLTVLAVYQNYYHIITTVRGFVMIIFSSAQAGVGNYLITKSEAEKKDLLYRFQYLSMLIVAVSSCCMINMYQPFMKLWVGEKYLLEYPLVILFTISFSIDIFMRPLLLFKDSSGMWNEDKFRPLAAAFVNLGLNLATVKWLGLYGVIGSTIISMLFVAFPWLIVNTNRHLMKIETKRFLLDNAKYFLIAIFSCGLSYFVCSKVTISNEYLNLIILLLISVVIPAALFETINYRSNENRYFLSLIRDFLARH